MTDALGLSIGTTNLVAAHEGRPPLIRRSILTLFNNRAPEVGGYSAPGEHGLTLTGFVERVGDPVPIVAADGSQHRGELALAEALDALARTAGGAPVTIAVPAYWGPATVDVLRGALRGKPALAPNGVPAALVPDSLTALSALQAGPGLPDHGVVVLCDLGGSGTSVTLADAGARLAAIGQTVRHPDFSGDQIDQALLNHVLSDVAAAGSGDPAGTAAVGSLTQLRAACRDAKERLSAETSAVIHTELPGFTSDVRVTRAELEQLVAEPLAGLLLAVEDTLRRNNIAPAQVTAVATVGGSAAIPLVTQRLSERLRAPVISTAGPQFAAATGAALIAESAADAGAPTGMAPGIHPAYPADAPTGLAPGAYPADAPTGMAPGGYPADAPTSMAPGGDTSGAALAWSEDDGPTEEPVPYAGSDYSIDGYGSDAGDTSARPQMAFTHDEEAFDTEPGPLPWYKRPPILFGAAAAAVLLAAGGLAVTLTGTSTDSTPVTETTTARSGEPASQAPQPEPVTTVTVGPDGQQTSTVTVLPPPPETSSEAPPPPETTTTTEPTTTTAPTTTTTTPPTTTTTAPTTTTTTAATTSTTTAATTTRSRPNWWPTRPTRQSGESGGSGSDSGGE